MSCGHNAVDAGRPTINRIQPHNSLHSPPFSNSGNPAKELFNELQQVDLTCVAYTQQVAGVQRPMIRLILHPAVCPIQRVFVTRPPTPAQNLFIQMGLLLLPNKHIPVTQNRAEDAAALLKRGILWHSTPRKDARIKRHRLA